MLRVARTAVKRERHAITEVSVASVMYLSAETEGMVREEARSAVTHAAVLPVEEIMARDVARDAVTHVAVLPVAEIMAREEVRVVARDAVAQEVLFRVAMTDAMSDVAVHDVRVATEAI